MKRLTVKWMEQQKSSENDSAPVKTTGLSKAAKFLLASFVGLITAALGGFVVHREHVVGSFESSYEQISDAQQEWIIQATALISDSIGAEPGYPTVAEARQLRDTVLSAVVELGEFRAPDSTLASFAQQYRISLERLAGALNQYDATPVTFDAAASAAQVAANAGGDFKDEINRYSADFLRKTLGAIRWS